MVPACNSLRNTKGTPPKNTHIYTQAHIHTCIHAYIHETHTVYSICTLPRQSVIISRGSTAYNILVPRPCKSWSIRQLQGLHSVTRVRRLHGEMLGYKYDQCSRWHIFALKKTRASGRNFGKVFNPVVKLVLENQPFLMPEPAEKPSLQSIYVCQKH